MAFIVVYDACVLYPARLRDLLIRIAQTSVVRARWTNQILDECFRSILEQRPDLRPAALERTRDLMIKAVPDCIVTGYEDLIQGLELADEKDRHVLAAAIRASAQTIVTFNLKDFPAAALDPLGIEAQHPDDFVLDAIDLAPGKISECIRRQAAALKNPPMSIEELLQGLSDAGLPQSVAKLLPLV
jgi:hypothetical protein